MATVRSAAGEPRLPSTRENRWILDANICFTVIATVLVMGGFFLPWIRGAGILSLRSFSGFELSRIVRDLGPESTVVPLPGLILYLVPATVLNAAALIALAGNIRLSGFYQGVVSLVAGLYGCAVTGTILFLVLAPASGLHDVARGPQAGLFLVLGGCLALIISGLRRLQTR